MKTDHHSSWVTQVGSEEVAKRRAPMMTIATRSEPFAIATLRLGPRRQLAIAPSASWLRCLTRRVCQDLGLRELGW